MYVQIYLVHTNVPRFTYTLTYKTHTFIVIYKRRCNVGVNAANSTNSLYICFKLKRKKIRIWY